MAFVLFCFCFCFLLFLFLFLIIQSQAAFVNCLYVARFTIVHSKTQIKFPSLLLFVVLPDCLSVVVVLCLKNYGTSRHCKYTCTLYVNSKSIFCFLLLLFFFQKINCSIVTLFQKWAGVVNYAVNCQSFLCQLQLVALRFLQAWCEV